jgi:streptomycin 6-kinase
VTPSLEERLAACVRLWGLVLGEDFERSYNYVYAATRAGCPVVLKLGCAGEYTLEREAAALGVFGGRGAVRILERDVANGALLLERATPGRTLLDLSLTDDEQATAVAADVMSRLWRPAPEDGEAGPLKAVAKFSDDFADFRSRFDGSGPLDAPRFDHAERLFAELLASSAEPVVLHGDLHHLNILSAERTPWLAIDPKGVLGEPAYETGGAAAEPVPSAPRLRLPGPAVAPPGRPARGGAGAGPGADPGLGRRAGCACGAVECGRRCGRRGVLDDVRRSPRRRLSRIPARGSEPTGIGRSRSRVAVS